MYVLNAYTELNYNIKMSFVLSKELLHSFISKETIVSLILPAVEVRIEQKTKALDRVEECIILFESGCVNNHDGLDLKTLYLLKKKTEFWIKAHRIEKTVYLAFEKKNPRIFPLLLSRYQELICEIMDLISQTVVGGFETEKNYLDFCKETKQGTEEMRWVCEYGERITAC